MKQFRAYIHSGNRKTLNTISWGYIFCFAAKEEEKQKLLKWSSDLKQEREQLEQKVKQLSNSITVSITLPDKSAPVFWYQNAEWKLQSPCTRLIFHWFYWRLNVLFLDFWDQEWNTSDIHFETLVHDPSWPYNVDMQWPIISAGDKHDPQQYCLWAADKF